MRAIGSAPGDRPGGEAGGVRYDEGVAIHVGPEPCVSGREARGEASAGDRAGQPLSRDSPVVPDADAVTKAEGHTSEGASASPRSIRRGQRPWHARTLLAREPGDLPPDHRPSGRLVRIGNAGQDRTRRAQDRASVSKGLDRVRHVARQRKKERFTALLHHVTPNLLRTAFFALKRQAAPGVDGLTWQAYEADLEPRIESLHERVHRGAYRALPARRGFIPKADGSQRPLAIV